MVNYQIPNPMSSTRFKLRDCYQSWSTSSNQITLKTSNQFTVLEGEGLNELLPPILEKLVNPVSVDDLFKASKCISLNDLNELLSILEKQEVVVKEPKDIDKELMKFYSQICYFSERVPNGVELQQTLKNSTIAVIGLGILGSTVAKTLAEAGVEKLALIDDCYVSQDDAWVGGQFTTQQVGRQRSTVVKEQISTYSDNLLASSTHLNDFSLSELAELIPEFDLVVACLEEREQFLTLNKACAKAAVRWISCQINSDVGTIGPAIIPGETSCFECYRSWEISNDTQFDSQLLFDKNNLINGRPQVMTSIPNTYCIAAITAAEVIKLVTKFSLAVTLNRVVTFNFSNMSSEVHRVLQIPYCQVCGLGRNTAAVKVFHQI